MMDNFEWDHGYSERFGMMWTNFSDSSRIGQIFGDSDLGDNVMLVTLGWWLISDVGGRIIMLATFFVMLAILSVY